MVNSTLNSSTLITTSALHTTPTTASPCPPHARCRALVAQSIAKSLAVNFEEKHEELLSVGSRGGGKNNKKNKNKDKDDDDSKEEMTKGIRY